MNKPLLADDRERRGLQQLSKLARSLADGLASAAASRIRDWESNLAPKVRAYLKARRRRDALFGDMFADPVWDVLLDLFASKLEGRRVCISDACIAASVPTTTALRWLGKMEECKLIVRHQDAMDGRRAYVELSVAATAAMERWLEAFFTELNDPARAEGEGRRCAGSDREAMNGAIDGEGPSLIGARPCAGSCHNGQRRAILNRSDATRS